MKKVLIVEDDEIVASIYRNKFSAEGFEAKIAPDGLAGLGLVRSFRPDAVILDLMLPKMSGVEVLRKLRTEPEFVDLPVIVLSNTYLSNLVTEAWKAGATKCLSKANSTPKQVVEAVRQAFPADGSVPAPANAFVKAPPSIATAAAAPQPATPAEPSPLREPEAASPADLRSAFIESLPATLAALRALLQRLIKAESEAIRLQQLQGLYQQVHALTGKAAAAGVPQIARVCDALEALLKELEEKPRNINASTVRTVASAVDLMGAQHERGLLPEKPEILQAPVLVVDDEAISRRAVVYALEKAKLKSVSVEDPDVAYKLLKQDRFDLIILDVNLPGMNGFELCKKLRALPAHQKTPVVFVTSLNDLKSRASSTISGGNDFIAKPFLFIELALKALVYVLRGRLQAAG